MTCLVIWLWKLKISIFVCLFVYLFVCTSRFANFANGKWSNHDSKNCSEIRTVTWSVIWLWKLQFTILIFFTTLYHAVRQQNRISPELQGRSWLEREKYIFCNGNGNIPLLNHKHQIPFHFCKIQQVSF